MAQTQEAPPATGAAQDWRSEYAYTAGVQAFIYGFPYIYNAKLRHDWVTQARDPAVVPYAAVNQFWHAARLIDATYRDGGCPNNDALYSLAWLDLREGPVILSHPDMADRYFTFELTGFTPWLRLPTDAGTTLPRAGQPGHGRTAYLRRQPARIVDGRMEGGYTGAFELICGQCGDHPYLDYSQIPPRLQQIRGPYTKERAWPRMRTTSGSEPAADGHRTRGASPARPGQEPARAGAGGWPASLEPSPRVGGADMTDQPNQELPPATRRRLIIAAVLRGLVVTTVLVVLYYLMPLDQPWDTGTAVRLVIGLLVFAGITVWQVKAVAGSRYPGLRAAEALGLIIPLYLLLFASTYFLMERASAANFTQSLSRTDALYFSVTVFTTVGFGDIAAKSETARVVLIVQMLADLALLGAGARVLLGAVRRGQQRRSGTDDGDGPAST